MSYLDEPLGIPLGELRLAFEDSVRDLLRRRGCPAQRMDELVAVCRAHGHSLFYVCDDALLTRRLYARVVEEAVSLAMNKGKLVS